MAIEGPDDPFRLWLDFDQQRLPGASVAVAQNSVSIGKNFQGRDPGKANLGQVILVDLPNDLFLRSDLNNGVPIASGDKRVAIGQLVRPLGAPLAQIDP